MAEFLLADYTEAEILAACEATLHDRASLNSKLMRLRAVLRAQWADLPMVFTPAETRLLMVDAARGHEEWRRPAGDFTPHTRERVVEDLRCGPKAVAKKTSTDLDLQSAAALVRCVRS
jgi:hypothetical protein